MLHKYKCMFWLNISRYRTVYCLFGLLKYTGLTVYFKIPTWVFPCGVLIRRKIEIETDNPGEMLAQGYFSFTLPWLQTRYSLNFLYIHFQ